MIKPNFIAGYLVDISTQPARYLLLRRAQTVFLPGIWQMVTGKVEQGESAAHAVWREIEEESGIVPDEIFSVDVTSFYDRGKGVIAFSANFCALCTRAPEVELSAAEHDLHQWCSFVEAMKLLAFPAQKDTLAHIHQHYVLHKADPVNRLPDRSVC